MPNVAACPHAEQWQQLLLGRLPEKEAASLEQHLADCPVCLQTIRTTPAGDTLVDALQAQGTTTAKPVPESVRRLVDRLKQLRAAVGPAGGETVDGPAADASNSSATAALPGPSQATSVPDAYDFLAPAETADEIGRLGPYRVLKVLGMGGMGVVFLAEDPRLKRRVALKAMKPALAASETARARFLREAQATASLDHDHIVHIYQVGEDRGAPFLAMQLLKGETLEDRLQREGRLPAAEVLRIGREAAEGLAAAHAVGLIHRDVKPSNLWLEGERGRVKVLDFGLARAVEDDSRLTQSGAVTGTPAYMAPEQAQGQPVDARCDLFSLGCVLYRAATGEAPFQGAGTMAILLSLVQHQPPPPQTLNPAVSPELSALVMRLMSKDPTGRPPSARAVVEAIADIERDRTTVLPAVAAPPTRKEKRPRRWLPWAVAAALGAAAILAAAAAVVTLRTHDGVLTVMTSEPDVKIFVDGQEKIVIDSKKVGKVELVPGTHHLTVKRGDEELFSDDFSLKSGGEAVVEAHWQPRLADDAPKPSPAGASPLDALRAEDISAAERFDGQPKELVAVIGEQKWRHWDQIWHVAVSPDGAMVASAGRDGLRVWEAATGRQRAFLPNYEMVAMTADGKTLACAKIDGTITLWDVAAGEAVSTFKRAAGLRDLAVSPDGKTLACSGNDGSLWLLDAATGEQQAAFANEEGAPQGLAFSPDGKLLAALLDAGEKTDTVRVWDVAGRKIQGNLKHATGWGRQLAFSPDGRTLAVPGWAKDGVQIWDVNSGKLKDSFQVAGGGGNFSCVHYTPDGKTLIVGVIRGDGYTQAPTLVWMDAATGARLNDVSTGEVQVESLAVSADGKVVVSAGSRVVRRWDAATAKPLDTPRGHLTGVAGLAFAPDGRTLASTSGDSESLTLWDAGTGRERTYRESNHGAFGGVAFSPDGKTFAVQKDRDAVEIRATAGGEVLRTIRPKEGENYAYITGLAFTPDGRTLAAAFVTHTILLSDPATGERKALLDLKDGALYRVAISPDGKTLAAGLDYDRGAAARVELWDVPTGQRKKTWAGVGATSMAFSADGKTLLAEWWNALGFWDVATGERKHVVDLTGDRNVQASGLALSPDGKQAAVSTWAGLVLLDPATGEEIRRWKFPGPVACVAFAPDGRHLATGNGNGTVYILRLDGDNGAARPSPDAAKPSPLEALRAEDIPAAERFDGQPEGLAAVIGEQRWRHWGDVLDVAVSPDGSVVASYGRDGARVWEADTGRQRLFLPGVGKEALAMTVDGKTLAYGKWDGTVTLWDVGTGETRATFKRPAGIVSLAFAPDGKSLACSGDDKSLWLLDAVTGEQLVAFANKEGSAKGLRFSPDGRLLAGILDPAEQTNTVRLWDVKGGKIQVDLKQPMSFLVNAPAFSPDGRTLAVPGPVVTLWDVNKGQPGQKFPAPTGVEASCVHYTPDGKTLIVGLAAGYLLPQPVGLLWLDAKTGEQRNAVSTGDENAAALAISADGKVLVSAGRRAVRRWDAVTAKPLDPPHGHLTAVTSLAFAPDGRTLGSTSEDAESVSLWDAASRRERFLPGYRFERITYSPDGKTFAVRDGRDAVEIHATARGEKLRAIRLKDGENYGWITGLVFTPDGRTLAAAFVNHTMVLSDPATGERKALLDLKEGGLFRIAISPDGKTLAAGLDQDQGGKERVELWDVATGRRKKAWAGVGAAALVYSADGKTLTTGWGSKVQFWDAADGERQGEVDLTAPIADLALSPDGKTLAAATTAGVALLDATDGHVLRQWKFPGPVSHVAFAPDGRHLATGNGNGTVYVLRLEPAP